MPLAKACRGAAAVTLLAIAASASAGVTPVGGPAASRHVDGPRAVEGEALVGFARRVSPAGRAAALASVGARAKRRFSEIGAVLATVPPRTGALERLARDPRVRYVESNFVLSAFDHGGVPNDPGFHELWGLHNFGQTVNGIPGTANADVDAPEAWQVTTGGPGIVVGVIDTGVDYTHPDLAANVWINPGENCPGCRTDRVDNDGNGYVDDFRGWDFLNDDNDPFDDHGHGTHVAGTIGAVGDNGVGVAGVNWSVKVMPLKFLGADGSGTTADAVRAVLYAADAGALVTNNSYGGDGFSQAFADAIAYADAHDSLFVAAAGNSIQNIDATPTYPASFAGPNVLTVAATESSDRRAWFSNYGRRSVELGAPGDNIYSTLPGAAYDYLSGTSMASPHVAGAAALAKAAHPSATDLGLKTLLVRTVDSVPVLAEWTSTGGRLDVGAAVRCAGAPQAWIEAPASGFVAAIGQPLTVTVLAAACGDPGAVSVNASANGGPFVLVDRGDGLYSGTVTPSEEGPLTVVVSAAAGGVTDTRTVTGTVPRSIVAGGDAVTVTTTAPDENVLLAFSGAAGQRVFLKLTGVTIGSSTCCGAKVSLLNPDGSTLIPAAYVGTSGGFLDAKALPAAGTYTILLDPQGTATGSATLTLYDVPPDASAPIVAGGAAVTLATSVPGQNGKLSFSVGTGRSITLQVSGLSMSLAKVSLLGPNGTVIAPTYVTASGRTFTATLGSGGTYTIVFDPDGASVGSATFRLA